MAKKERQKRAARQARQKERAEREKLAAAQGQKGSDKEPGTAVATSKNAKGNSPKKAKGDAKPKHFRRIRNYFGGVRSEMHRVVWPSKSELKNYSVAVIIMLIVFGIVVWAVDTGVLALFAEYTGLRSVLGL